MKGEAVEKTSMTIAIVGLGYVGLPLALQFARNGVSVVGLDVDPAKVSAVNAGQSYIKHIEGPSSRRCPRGGCARRTISRSSATSRR